MAEFTEARHRLVFDELFTLQLTLAKRRHQFDQEEKSISLKSEGNALVEKLLSNLPFSF
jgi:RecG-like helicase